MKKWLKRLAIRSFPQRAARLLAARSRSMNQKLVKRIGSFDLTAKLVSKLGSTVQSGPFAGTVLTPTTHAEHLGPYLLGTYERELHPTWQRLAYQTFSQVIDVGAKFGYYAVGLARIFPSVPVLAFDTDRWAQAAVAEMASVNGTSNVSALGSCDPEWFDLHLRPGALIVSDCEGYESKLFAMETPALRSAHIVVEIHDFIAPGTTEILSTRFADTHTREAISSRPCEPPPGIDLSFLDVAERNLAVDEMRMQTQWLVFTPLLNPCAS